MQNKKNVIIIGGGASGIMAAISCKKHNPNYDVFILEKNFKLGRKILATGNGRCNILNKNLTPERFHTNSNLSLRKFIESVFDNFNENDMCNFFELQNLSLREESGDRIFPFINQSVAVVKALEYELERLNIKIKYNTIVEKISKNNNNFFIKTNKQLFESDYVIIATGGLSYKNLGSTGDGYKFAKNFNHKITKTFPSITALKINSKLLKNISGVRQEAIVRIISDNKNIKEYYEELLFTDYGVSGSAILQISRFAIENLLKKNKVEISIQFTKPKITKQKVKEILNRQIKLSSGKNLKSVLLWFLNTTLIENLFGGLENKNCNNITEKELESIIKIITDTRFEITGFKEWEQAQITAGGININEINPKTLESKKEKGLYFCGEILDIDGDCGGFNLSWAWSSGYLAGKVLKSN